MEDGAPPTALQRAIISRSDSVFEFDVDLAFGNADILYWGQLPRGELDEIWEKTSIDSELVTRAFSIDGTSSFLGDFEGKAALSVKGFDNGDRLATVSFSVGGKVLVGRPSANGLLERRVTTRHHLLVPRFWTFGDSPGFLSFEPTLPLHLKKDSSWKNYWSQTAGAETRYRLRIRPRVARRIIRSANNKHSDRFTS